jgi:hypothetical protein
MELVPPFVPPLVDHTRYFRHAPARLRVVADMFDLAGSLICRVDRLLSNQLGWSRSSDAYPG